MLEESLEAFAKTLKTNEDVCLEVVAEKGHPVDYTLCKRVYNYDLEYHKDELVSSYDLNDILTYLRPYLAKELAGRL